MNDTSRLAGLLALFALSACTVAGPRPGDGPGDRPGVPTSEPEVRVGLAVDSPSVQIDGTGAFELADEGGRVRARGRAGTAWVVRRDGEGVEARSGGESVRVRGALVVRPAGSGQVLVNGSRYRGAILVRPAGSGVTAVNLLDLETYLLGVVPHEIGPNRPPEELEAVKAQAVAARTYAIRHMGRRSELGFDLYATVSDQVYGGADSEDATASRAVRETRGTVITYDGRPIEAYYHSTCGGRTASMHEVWDASPQPYLRSVSDARPGGGWYCETSNRFRWIEEWTRDELLSTLEAGLGRPGAGAGAITRVDAMDIPDRTTSGRAAALTIRTDAGDFTVPGDSIRWVLRPEPNRILNSTAIALHPEGEAEVEGLVVEGAGWGHGIGMCQVGAMGRARDGQSYREILQAYYPGTRVTQLYR